MLFNFFLVRLSSHFITPGPKKQDIAEIKARATSARKKAKFTEKMERLNLAYCRIMLGSQSSTISDNEERKADVQFKSMVKLLKDIDSSNLRDLGTPNGSLFTFPTKRGDIEDLVLFAARNIYMRREKSTSDRSTNSPYDLLFSSYGKEHDKHISILLEFLNTLLLLASDLRDSTENTVSTRAEKIDVRAADVGIELVSCLRQKVSNTPRDQGMNNSTLFSNTEQRSDAKVIRTIKDTREAFSRALSIYYSSGKGYPHAVKWCDHLIEILYISQHYSQIYKEAEIPHENFEHTISEILAVKALSLSMTNCHGAALKSAREAYEKCGTEVGNIVTLFHCSVRYEVNSIQDNLRSETFENTLLELDNAVSTFLSETALEELNLGRILDAFPVMFNTIANAEVGQFGSLLLGLQKRYVDLLVHFVTSMITKGEINIQDDQTMVKVPGDNNIFCILCNYLASFDETISSSRCNHGTKWLFDQYQILQQTLDSVLKLLIEIRDLCSKNNDSLSQFSLSFQESTEPRKVETQLFQKANIMTCVGKSEDCLWIGKATDIF